MEIDSQTIFNGLFTVLGILGGWVLNSIKQSIERLEREDATLSEKLQHIEVLVAGQYVRRDDFDKVCDKLFLKLDKIDLKLDGKADK